MNISTLSEPFVIPSFIIKKKKKKKKKKSPDSLTIRALQKIPHWCRYTNTVW